MAAKKPKGKRVTKDKRTGAILAADRSQLTKAGKARFDAAAKKRGGKLDNRSKRGRQAILTARYGDLSDGSKRKWNAAYQKEYGKPSRYQAAQDRRDAKTKGVKAGGARKTKTISANRFKSQYLTAKGNLNKAGKQAGFVVSKTASGQKVAKNSETGQSFYL